MDSGRVGIVGAPGYTGMELLRLLAGHPNLEVCAATADSRSGRLLSSVAPALAADYPDLVLDDTDPDLLDGLDVVFVCTPHESAMELVPQLLGRVRTVVDLSGAHRFRDPAVYPQWYGFEHTHPDVVARAVYGLPERNRESLVGAELIAVPGCYVTAATFALRPLVERGLIEPTGIIVDAVSGTSGAGRAGKEEAIFAEVDGGVAVYGLLTHRHTPEMEDAIGARILFTPHLAPMTRGILATCYASPASDGLTTARVLAELARGWEGEHFVTVRPELPSTKATVGTNAVHLSARYDERTGTVVALSALDNLGKGASGAAVQCANVALGLPEASGLARTGVWP